VDREYLHTHPDQLAACQALVYSLLQRCDAEGRERGSALAIVSYHPGAGVSHVQTLLEQMLNENEANCAISLDCETLGSVKNSLPRDAKSPAVDSRVDDDASRDVRKILGRDSRLARYRDRVGHLSALLDAYRYVLLDCHSLKEKTDVLGLAPLLDGIIIVVQCNRTTTNQVYELERSIERYGGTVLGTVLNKTTYTIPAWMNSLMGRVGL
jgi:hypothetical protein